MCIYTCVCVYVHGLASPRTLEQHCGPDGVYIVYMCMGVYVCMCTCVYVCIYVCIYCVYVCIRVYVCVYICMHGLPFSSTLEQHRSPDGDGEGLYRYSIYVYVYILCVCAHVYVYT